MGVLDCTGSELSLGPDRYAVPRATSAESRQHGARPDARADRSSTSGNGDIHAVDRFPIDVAEGGPCWLGRRGAVHCGCVRNLRNGQGSGNSGSSTLV